MKLSDIDEWLSIKIAYIPDLDDKVHECAFFLDLASKEHDVDKFRWLISAFLNGAYSYFEICALQLHNAFTNPDTGEPVKDYEAIEILSKYVKIHRNEKNPSYIKTTGHHPVTVELWKIRKINTHYGSLTIVPKEEQNQDSYEFFLWQEAPKPALKFCREVMELIYFVKAELEI